ncbi:MAG: hypothetical protein Q4D44_08515 [Eubacteriales bacterium]|nr:hypothetical protein [Eubacteriales bacterium]
MIGFCDLHYAVKSIFLVVTFVTVCLSACLLPRALCRKKLITKLLVPLCFLLGGAMLITFAAQVKSAHPAWRTSTVVEGVTALPIILPILLLLAIIAVLLIIVVKEWRFEKNSITRSSVKESLDYLNTGLCFAYKNGMVMLINHRMNNLSHTIFGRDLQNANAFWENLINGEIQSGVTRLSMGANPSLRLPDKTVWTFAREVIDGITQLTAAETTRLNKLTEELKEKNAELTVMNERLRKYGENVDKLTREKERLETKVRIHRELGQALLSTRRYLQSESDNPYELLNMLKRNIAMLRMESEIPKNDEPLDILMKAAHSAGIKVEIVGQMPKQKDANMLFFDAATEALTNAVRHADAKTLRIAFSEDNTAYSVCFTNDGNQPQNEIVEGGGLGSIRQKTEQIGGTMEVLYKPKFILRLTVIKKRGDNL